MSGQTVMGCEFVLVWEYQMPSEFSLITLTNTYSDINYPQEPRVF